MQLTITSTEYLITSKAEEEWRRQTDYKYCVAKVSALEANTET